METNAKNKKIFNDAYNDFVNTYKSDKDFTNEELKHSANVFATVETIRKVLTSTKSYKIAYGSIEVKDLCLYDIVIPINNHTSYFDYPCIILSNNADVAIGYRPIYKHGHIKEDIFEKIEFNY